MAKLRSLNRSVYQVYGGECVTIPGLNTIADYFFTGDAVNDTGITKGTEVRPVRNAYGVVADKNDLLQSFTGYHTTPANPHERFHDFTSPGETESAQNVNRIFSSENTAGKKTISLTNNKFTSAQPAQSAAAFRPC